MTALKAIIIDDDAAIHKWLESHLNEFELEVNFIDHCYNGSSGIDSILANKPDVVFLDIEMPDMSGFDLLKQLEKQEFQLVIVTGHQDYALKALRASAIDFLLKPIDKEEYSKCLKKLISNRKKLENESRQVFLQNISALQLQKVIIPTEEGWNIVSINDIVSCHADSVYTHIKLISGEQLLSSKPLKEYTQILPTSAFSRVHKSHLVHLKFIKKYNKGRGGQLEMVDGSIIPVSRQRKNHFMDLLHLYTYQKPV